MKHRPYQQVNGLITNDECNHLFDLARAVEPGGVIVELGTYHGKSALALRSGAPEGVTVYTVDPFQPYFGKSMNGEHQYTGEADLEAFRANTHEWDINLIRNTSLDAARGWDGSPINLLFIDAIHTYEDVKADFEAWGQFVPVGGVIAFHDANEPQVGAVIDEVLATGQWEPLGRVALMVYIKRVSLPDVEPVIVIEDDPEPEPVKAPVKRTRTRRKATK